MLFLRKPTLKQPPMQEPTDSRRVHDRVRAYWEGLREQRMYPQEREVDPQAILEAWEHCFLVDISKGRVSKGFRYDYMGGNLIQAYGMNMTSLGNCDARTEPHIASMLKRFDEIVESGEPVMDESEFDNLQRMRVKYRCCLLPLGNNKVDYILGCMRWKAC